jgi:hypothetical protein
MAEPEGQPFNAGKMIDFYRLVRDWENFAMQQPYGDRYRNGIEICAEQLRETIERWVADHGV